MASFRIVLEGELVASDLAAIAAALQILLQNIRYNHPAASMTWQKDLRLVRVEELPKELPRTEGGS